MKHNTHPAFAVHITPHHLTLSPALSQFVREKVARLPRFAHDALAADVVLRQHHGPARGHRFSASARLALPGRDLHATASHADLYSAVMGLTRKLIRQSRKRETRRVSASRRPHHAPQHHRLTARQRPWGRRSIFSAPPEPSIASTAGVSGASLHAHPFTGQAKAAVFGLVECSSSLNPAHGISSRHLAELAACRPPLLTTRTLD